MATLCRLLQSVVDKHKYATQCRKKKHELNISIVIKYAAGAKERERERNREREHCERIAHTLLVSRAVAEAAAQRVVCLPFAWPAEFTTLPSLSPLPTSLLTLPSLIKESACVFCLTIYLTFLANCRKVPTTTTFSVAKANKKRGKTRARGAGGGGSM